MLLDRFSYFFSVGWFVNSQRVPNKSSIPRTPLFPSSGRGISTDKYTFPRVLPRETDFKWIPNLFTYAVVFSMCLNSIVNGLLDPNRSPPRLDTEHPIAHRPSIDSVSYCQTLPRFKLPNCFCIFTAAAPLAGPAAAPKPGINVGC